jgi:hypothetical protein
MVFSSRDKINPSSSSSTHVLTDFIGWYFRFNGNFTEDDISKIEDDIIKNDFDGVSSLFSACHRRVIAIFHTSTSIRIDFEL